ncbi:hypothetical protein HBN50_06275 [Halobacteriovorax sp. GB3]|uniref:hypothetical protein n=1 Tax=Halobacteriovorax sp. GB3 TaxID=2719615 RepID=UPI00236263A5|nr:hypothetical protein [Halobacteriovorax sp. GB3]MDD0852693.1 hypothetical protein [Halobacteriovorax sp. GB3]
MNKLILIPFLFIFASCSLIIKSNESKVNLVLKDKKEKELFCNKSNTQFYIQNEQTYLLIQNLNKKVNLSAQEILVATVLTEIFNSPFAVSIDSQIQFLDMNLASKNFEHSYYLSDKRPTNLFDSLRYYLKKNKAKYSLGELISLVERELPTRITISKRYARFLSGIEQSIRSDEKLSATYLRGNQLIKANETIRRSSLKRIYNVSRLQTKEQRKKKVTNNSYLFPYVTNDQKYLCNYDLNIYENSIFLISKDKRPQTLELGAMKNNFSAMAVLRLYPRVHSKKLSSHSLFGQSQTPRPVAICHKSNSNEIFVSSKGPDSAQILQQFIKNYAKLTTKKNLKESLYHSRNIVMIPPKRILSETKKLDSNDLENLLKSDNAVYHVENIGNIWGLHSKSFFQDPRSVNSLRCI